MLAETVTRTISTHKSDVVYFQSAVWHAYDSIFSLPITWCWFNSAGKRGPFEIFWMCSFYVFEILWFSNTVSNTFFDVNYDDITCTPWRRKSRHFDCLFNSVLRLTSKKTSQPRITDPLWREFSPPNSPHKETVTRNAFPFSYVIKNRKSVIIVEKCELSNKPSVINNPNFVLFRFVKAHLLVYWFRKCISYRSSL